jgi:transposase
MSPMMIDLTLPGYRMIRVERNPELRISLEVRKAPAICPCCGASRLHSKGRYERRVRHLECFGRPSWLHIACRRYRCVDCGRSFVQPLPGILPGRHSTEPLRETIYQRHDDGICASTLARRTDMGHATVSRIYAQFTARKAKERLSLDCPHILGIDEHSLHRKQRFATTFCDLKNRRVFDITPGKSAAQLQPFLGTLRGRDRVRVVCIDLSNSYRALIQRWFPRAMIVADRFHVVRVVMRHLLGIARQVCPQLAWKLSWLTLLRTRGDRLTFEQRQRLAAVFQQQPALQPIYDLKERLCALLCIKKQTAAQCRQLIPQLLAFICTLKTSGFELARTLAKTLQDWSEEIVRMWRFTRNNGITEGFHRKMKLIQRRAYGIKNFANYRLRVIAQCG